MNNENKLGDFIRSKRGNRSLREFAALCDISHTHLDSIEKGIDPRTGKKVSITVDTLQRIALALRVPVGELLSLYNNTDPKGETQLELDGVYLRLAKEAQEKGLTPNDVRKIISLYEMFKKEDDE